MPRLWGAHRSSDNGDNTAATTSTPERQTLNMLGNPIVAPFLAERFGENEVTLEALLEELEAFGQVVLTSVPVHSCPADRIERRHSCAVIGDWSTTTLSADGVTRLLAALRCLMEALAETERQARRGADKFASFLADQ